MYFNNIQYLLVFTFVEVEDGYIIDSKGEGKKVQKASSCNDNVQLEQSTCVVRGTNIDYN